MTPSRERRPFEGAKLFDPTQKDIDYIASYMMKGSVSEYGFRADDDGKEWKVYPNVTSKTEPRYKRKGLIVPDQEEVPSFDDEFLTELQRSADESGFRSSVQAVQAIRDYKRSRQQRRGG